MESKSALEDLLEILLITYNRSVSLDNTLNQLKNSPFISCRFTVLDNCSSDETPEVAEKYAPYFQNYRIVRHNRNIGGDYNYLRAVELSKTYYTWVLCDDDNYDFSHVEPVIEAITSMSYDLIYVASRSPVQLGWEKFGGTTVPQLTREGARYHRACAFWPSLIFRTERYDNYCFGNAPYLFPSMKFINKSLTDGFSIYVAEYPVVIRTEMNTAEIHPLHMYKEWVTNAALIRDIELQRYVIEQWTDRGFFKSLAFWIALEKANRTEGYWKRLVDILFGLTPIQRMKFLLLIPVMLIPIPKSLLVKAREFVYRLMGHRDTGTLPPIDRVIRD